MFVRRSSFNDDKTPASSGKTDLKVGRISKSATHFNRSRKTEADNQVDQDQITFTLRTLLVMNSLGVAPADIRAIRRHSPGHVVATTFDG